MGNERAARYHVRRRQFLNEDPELPAFIIGVVEDTRDIPDENEDRWKWGRIQLELGDCYRRVSFDFDLSNAEERASSLNKINLIADVVNEVRGAIELEVESVGARPHVLHLKDAAVA